MYKLLNGLWDVFKSLRTNLLIILLIFYSQKSWLERKIILYNLFVMSLYFLYYFIIFCILYFHIYCSTSLLYMTVVWRYDSHYSVLISVLKFQKTILLYCSSYDKINVVCCVVQHQDLLCLSVEMLTQASCRLFNIKTTNFDIKLDVKDNIANLIATTAAGSWTECKQRFHCITAEWI